MAYRNVTERQNVRLCSLCAAQIGPDEVAAVIKVDSYISGRQELICHQECANDFKSGWPYLRVLDFQHRGSILKKREKEEVV